MDENSKDDWEKAMNAELQIECKGKIKVELLLALMGFYYHQN